MSLIALALIARSLIAAALILRALIAAALIGASRLLTLVPAPLVLRGRWRLQRRHGPGAVLHDAFEGAGAALVEIEAAGHRLEAHLEALHLDARARELHDEVVDDLVIQGVELSRA